MAVTVRRSAGAASPLRDAADPAAQVTVRWWQRSHADGIAWFFCGLSTRVVIPNVESKQVFVVRQVLRPDREDSEVAYNVVLTGDDGVVLAETSFTKLEDARFVYAMMLGLLPNAPELAQGTDDPPAQLEPPSQ